MKYALNLAENGRILSVTYEQYATADAVLVETLPEDGIVDYLYIDNEYIYDPLPAPVLPELKPSPEERITELELMLNTLLGC